MPIEKPAKQSLKTLTIIHYALVGALLVFLSFTYATRELYVTPISERIDLFLYIVPTAALGGYFLSNYLGARFLKTIDLKDTLAAKLQKYITVSLVKYACIEAPAFIALAAFLFDGFVLYLVIAISLLLYLFSQRPRIHRLKQELSLNREEVQQLR